MFLVPNSLLSFALSVATFPTKYTLTSTKQILHLLDLWNSQSENRILSCHDSSLWQVSSCLSFESHSREQMPGKETRMKLLGNHLLVCMLLCIFVDICCLLSTWSVSPWNAGWNIIILLPFLHNAFRLTLSFDFLACQQVYTSPKPRNTAFQHLDPTKELMPPQTIKTSTDQTIYFPPITGAIKLISNLHRSQTWIAPSDGPMIWTKQTQPLQLHLSDSPPTSFFLTSIFSPSSISTSRKQQQTEEYFQQMQAHHLDNVNTGHM